MTPYYEHAGITIYHGDCREILPQLGRFDLLLTDPPYGEVSRETAGLRSLDMGAADRADFDLAELTPVLLRACDGTAYVWCGIGQVSEIRRAMIEDGMSTRLCIWEKTNPMPMNGQHLWLSALECCMFGKRSGAAFNEFCTSPVFRGPIAENNGHPTPKPDWLMRKLLKASAGSSASVIDPFCGSGTTLVAAKEMGLSAVGIEREEKYCEIAASRLSQEVLAYA